MIRRRQFTVIKGVRMQQALLDDFWIILIVKGAFD